MLTAGPGRVLTTGRRTLLSYPLRLLARLPTAPSPTMQVSLTRALRAVPLPLRARMRIRGLCISAFHDPNPEAAEAEALLHSLASPPSAPSNKPLLQKVAGLARSAASIGSPRGKTILASMHREGLGAALDTEQAKRLFREAALEGDPIAQCSLGSLLIEPEDASRKEVSSSELVIAVDESGTQRATVELHLADGAAVEGKDAPSPAELVRRVRKARRKAGFTDDQAKEFEEHEEQQREEDIRRVREEAFGWLEKAAKQGNDEAMVLLANELLEEDPQRAEELYKEAVNTNKNTDAYFNLGHLYTNGAKGVDKDLRAAAMNFAMAAQLGDASAQFYLGHLYRVGSEHVEADAASARQYVELAAEQAHPAATYYLALMHRNGEGGLEVSQGAFRRYLTKAADLGHGPAHACLGEMYYKGTDGVPVNYKKALARFREAGSLGEADALCSAAAMVFRGLGTEEDQHAAFLLYQEAAQLGSLIALRNIGSMYFQGQGVPVNKKVAEHFFAMADRLEEKRRKEAAEHTKMPIRITEAPKHPMADIPRSIKSDDEDDWGDTGKEVSDK